MQNKTIAFLLTSLIFASFSLQASAQQRHEFVRGDMPPGMAAHVYKMSDRSLVGHTQAVQLVAPGETIIEVGDGQGIFSGAKGGKMSVAMGLGFVYRFKLSNLPIPGMAERTLYPSIEVLGKLNPPAGMENDFPVQVVLTRSDLQLALNGQMVTRIIYLEDPRGPLPHRHRESIQPSFDVSSGQDPLRAAETLGQPMAILRLGSRVPLKNDANDWFNFGVSTPQILPDPGQAGLQSETPTAKSPKAKKVNSDQASKKGPTNERVESTDAKVKPVAAVSPAGAKGKNLKVDKAVAQVNWQADTKAVDVKPPAPLISEVEIRVMPAAKKATSRSGGTPTLRRPNQL